jgi:3-methylfumaryl-CoA hydratase
MNTEREELIGPGPAQALAGLLGVPPPDTVAGLPLGWHWLYLLDRPDQADLGPDGHPFRGTALTPPAPGLRRMFAGGEIIQREPLRIGAPATRRATVLSTQDKHGRTGRLTFVSVGHEIHQDGRLVIRERQDIVYRARITANNHESDDGETRSVPTAEDEWSLGISPTLLFRFSALMYNAHRIHYDREYARDVEGYPGLLTHGPLQALAMAEAARARCGIPARGVTYEYRLVAPLFDHQGLVVRALTEDGTVHTSVRDKSGRQTAHGTIA